jgi:hypothetical protein
MYNSIQIIMKKQKQKLIIMFISFLFFYALFSDWDHFKDGLLGM